MKTLKRSVNALALLTLLVTVSSCGRSGSSSNSDGEGDVFQASIQNCNQNKNSPAYVQDWNDFKKQAFACNFASVSSTGGGVSYNDYYQYNQNYYGYNNYGYNNYGYNNGSYNNYNNNNNYYNNNYNNNYNNQGSSELVRFMWETCSGSNGYLDCYGQAQEVSVLLNQDGSVQSIAGSRYGRTEAEIHAQLRSLINRAQDQVRSQTSSSTAYGFYIDNMYYEVDLSAPLMANPVIEYNMDSGRGMAQNPNATEWN
ncbi:MAG: hypothetical protein ACPGJV_06380 [Bacteriovoracaceae bacterium]